jgi:hypothetical protein
MSALGRNRNSFFSAAFLFVAGGCASENTTLPDAASPPIDPPDASVAPPPPPAGDSLPTGAISFFNRDSCPSGWSPLDAAVGRTVVPGEPPFIGATQGAPLKDAEDRQHGHAISGTLPLKSVSYAGIAGEANHGVARGGMPGIAMETSQTSTGLPYVQLLICKKTAQPDAQARLAPSGTMVFFAASSCPLGWGASSVTQGRFIVGLPDSATPGQSFGGLPLTASLVMGMPQGERRGHQHVVKGTIATTSHGIALASGGAADGYAKDMKYAYEATSENAASELPYIMLLQCQKL